VTCPRVWLTSRMLESPKPSYAQVTARVAALELVVAEQAAVIVELRALVESLQVELAVWRRQAGRDSTNWSLPPSQDGPASKAKAKAKAEAKAEAKARAKARAEQRSGAKRTQGGQKGHRGTGLARVVKTDKVESVEPLACAGCGGDLAGAPGSVSSKVQVLDLEEHSPWIRRQRRSATIVMPMHQLDERELVAGYGASRATICRVLPNEDLSTAPT
jgi:transposase